MDAAIFSSSTNCEGWQHHNQLENTNLHPDSKDVPTGEHLEQVIFPLR